ncbi:hypothetical protein V7S43_012552 [Phytophthora oleae]|uniref:Uncharacterized protein n=1 Tax=Phytophthora oleae TaxID=2107226 RepID=A0ABD3F783_9STRA
MDVYVIPAPLGLVSLSKYYLTALSGVHCKISQCIRSLVKSTEVVGPRVNSTLIRKYSATLVQLL